MDTATILAHLATTQMQTHPFAIPAQPSVQPAFPSLIVLLVPTATIIATILALVFARVIKFQLAIFAPIVILTVWLAKEVLIIALLV
jgi:hypothetical protein